MTAPARPESTAGPPKRNPPGGGLGGLENVPFPGGHGGHSNAPEIATAQANFSRNPAAVREARRQLNLEFLQECAGGIRLHCELIQTFCEISDVAGVCYALRRLFAHARAAHPVFVGFATKTSGAGQ